MHMGTKSLPERRMTALDVDKPYIAGKTAWPEGAEYNYRAGGHGLRLLFGSARSWGMNSVGAGRAWSAAKSLKVRRGAHGP